MSAHHPGRTSTPLLGRDVQEVSVRDGSRIHVLRAITSTPEPPAIIIVDRSMALVELLSRRLAEHGHTSTGCRSPREAIEYARTRADRPPAALLVGLSYPSDGRSGIDIALAFAKWCPETAIVLYVDDRADERALFRIAWEAVHPASAVSRTSPVATLVETLEAVLEHGRADHDPLLGDTPSDRSSWRTATSYRQLVRHAGHAKLWRALLAHERPPRYKAIALATGLSVNTIRNYRDDLKSELRRHGVTDPTMREMHRFAHLARPLLEPILHQRNPGSSGDA